MSLLTGLSRFFGSSAGALNGSSVNYGAAVTSRTAARELSHRDLCEVLRAFSQVNGTYETLRALRFRVDADTANLKSVRNPCPAILSFFSSKSWPEPVEITTEFAESKSKTLTEQIEQVWQWSNWGQRRRFVAYSLAELGEVFVKVVASRERGRVWFEVIEAAYVCDFESDERDYLTWVRIDVPKCDQNHDTGELRHYTRTEVWDQDTGTYRIWETDGDQYGKPLNTFAAPTEEGTLAELGISFLPIVRIPFSDTGTKRGIGALQSAIEAIAEGDLMATNHHSVLFQDLEGATVIERDGTDAGGRPLPPVNVAPATPLFDAFGRQSNGTGTLPDGQIQVGKRAFWSLPGGAHLAFRVPPIDFAASLASLRDHDEYIERLCPSLAYARVAMMSGADLSGKALRYKLSAAIDQALEVRSNLLDGQKRLDEIALTLAQVIGLAEFRGLGTYEAGDFEHGFEKRSVVVESELEEAQTALARGQAAQAMVGAGVPLAVAADEALDMEEDDIAEMLDMATAEAEKAAADQQALIDQMSQQQPPAQGQPPMMNGQQQGQGGRTGG